MKLSTAHIMVEEREMVEIAGSGPDALLVFGDLVIGCTSSNAARHLAQASAALAETVSGSEVVPPMSSVAVVSRRKVQARPLPSEINNELLQDAMYLMAVDFLKHISGCWQCPASRTCECRDKHECPKHLCRYWLAKAENRNAGEVPSWDL